MYTQELTKQEVELLEQEILKIMNESDVDKEVIVSRIMFKVLLFATQNKENEILHDYAWKYFNENKDYFINKIP